MKALVLAAFIAALASPLTALAQGGAGPSSTGSSINSTGTGGTTGAGASGLNTSSDNNSGGSSAPAKSSTMRPGDNDPSRQTQSGRQAEPNAPGTQRK
ncbi:MAG TPA: hypothetical protein VNK51_16900 [Bradyrhizobium sp.]|nr:hypothetical protein [Bradyrhizobium sp.]